MSESEAVHHEELHQLYEDIFGQDRKILFAGLEGKKNLSILAVSRNGELAGFKMGYEQKNGQYYSWLGGIKAEYRKQGLASEVMKRQHEWLKREGYHSVQTKTKNKWRSMLILNIKCGFDIIGTYTDSKGELKIILEKKL
ncbi:GNAT family N-acetyltransferase [Fictibacillus sp. WQ 8-8]|uniref:GNAT family N-acetyltransferase n=1 Tax=Fictibacillus sp. WQ 8-8 TaxID=2938788 RepID=UPI0035C671E4